MESETLKYSMLLTLSSQAADVDTGVNTETAHTFPPFLYGSLENENREIRAGETIDGNKLNL